MHMAVVVSLLGTMVYHKSIAWEVLKLCFLFVECERCGNIDCASGRVSSVWIVWDGA